MAGKELKVGERGGKEMCVLKMQIAGRQNKRQEGYKSAVMKRIA